MWEINEAFSAVVLANIKVCFTFLTPPGVCQFHSHSLYLESSQIRFKHRTCAEDKASVVILI